MKKIVVALSALALAHIAQPGQSSASELIVSGTGMALAATRQAAEVFMARTPEVQVKVLPSMGSGGGIKALMDGVLNLSVAARRLKPKEIAAGVQEEFCIKTALVFATQPKYALDVKLKDLPKLYQDAAPVWPDGSPLTVILRAHSGSEMPYLAKRVPGLGEAFATARTRPEVPIGITDQINAGMAETTQGSFAITSLLQLVAEDRHLAPLSVDGIPPSAETLKDGSYPFSILICVLSRKGNVTPEAQAFLDFLKSDGGTMVFNRLGALSIK